MPIDAPRRTTEQLVHALEATRDETLTYFSTRSFGETAMLLMLAVLAVAAAPTGALAQCWRQSAFSTGYRNALPIANEQDALAVNRLPARRDESRCSAAWLTLQPTSLLQTSDRSRQGSVLKGAVIGAVVGVAVGMVKAENETDCPFCWLSYSIKYGAGGAAVGAVIGLFRSESTSRVERRAISSR